MNASNATVISNKEVVIHGGQWFYEDNESMGSDEPELLFKTAGGGGGGN